MSTFEFTHHGRTRAKQRRFRNNDIELARRYGVRIRDREAKVYLLRRKDVERAIQVRKQEIQRLEQLCGCKVVFANNRLVTIHHTSHAREKLVLRRAR